MPANRTRISANAGRFLERECLRMGAFFLNANGREWDANFRECGVVFGTRMPANGGVFLEREFPRMEREFPRMRDGWARWVGAQSLSAFILRLKPEASHGKR
jgi:hypothetical protein